MVRRVLTWLQPLLSPHFVRWNLKWIAHKNWHQPEIVFLLEICFIKVTRGQGTVYILISHLRHNIYHPPPAPPAGTPGILLTSVFRILFQTFLYGSWEAVTRTAAQFYLLSWTWLMWSMINLLLMKQVHSDLSDPPRHLITRSQYISIIVQLTFFCNFSNNVISEKRVWYLLDSVGVKLDNPILIRNQREEMVS